MEILTIFLVALIGGMLPLLVKWTDRLLHSALALSTGIFLGAVFLHMLPGLSEFDRNGQHVEAPATTAVVDPPAEAPAVEHDHHGHLIWLAVLVGVLGVYLLEGMVFRSHDHDDLHRHRAVGYASLIGLSAHSLTTGLGLAASQVDAEMSSAVFIAIVAHKGFETFSLATVFQLAEFTRRWIFITMLLYATLTPIGVVVGQTLFAQLPSHLHGIILALAAGTFLYVCLCELLPELFHHKEDIFVKMALLGGGVGLMMLVEGAHG